MYNQFFTQFIFPIEEDDPMSKADSLVYLKKLPYETLVDLYWQLYDHEPIQDDRGHIIRHIYIACHKNKQDYICRPPATTLSTAHSKEVCHPLPSSHPTKLDSIQIPYQASSGNYSWLTCDLFYMDRDTVPIMNDYQRFASCGNCKGSGGGCPVYSPHYNKLKPSADHMFLISLSIDFKWVFKNVWYERQDSYKRATLLFLMFPDRMTDRYLSRVTRSIRENKEVGFNLLCGNCEGCKAKDCTVNHPIDGRSFCSNPSARTFSMESVGVDCDALHYDLYNEWLPWYFKGTDLAPAYMTRYTGFLTSSSPEECLEIFKKRLQEDKSYNPEIPGPDYVDPDIHLAAQTMPIWHHKGELQLAYGITLPK